jgi:hypothetical protein
MEILYNIPFLFLEPPNLKLKRLSVPLPSAKTVFFMVLTSYFLVCAGKKNYVYVFAGVIYVLTFCRNYLRYHCGTAFHWLNH